MRVRTGLLRAFIALLWAVLLVLPVGVETPEGVVPVSVGEALAELARGRLGVGVLGALVAGGGVARAGTVRVVLILLASLAFWLAGRLGAPASPQGPLRRVRCPHCGAWRSPRMAECPACGRRA